MRDAVAAYLGLRRAAGFDMANAEYLLDSFARFATERSETHVHTQTAIDWAVQGPSAAQRNERLKAICRFSRHVRVEDARHELPPANYFRCRKTRRMDVVARTWAPSHPAHHGVGWRSFIFGSTHGAVQSQSCQPPAHPQASAAGDELGGV